MNVGAEDAASPRGSAFDFISKSDPDVEIETSIINEDNGEDSVFSFMNKAKEDESSTDNVIIIVIHSYFRIYLLNICRLGMNRKMNNLLCLL